MPNKNLPSDRDLRCFYLAYEEAMDKYISQKAKDITKSQTLAISAKAKKLKANGVDVISFTAGEPDCRTPEYICEAAKAAIDRGFTKYTPSSGKDKLRKRIAEKLSEENGLSYDYKQIIVSNGAKHSLFNALYALINDGDEVIIPAPYWLTYPELVKICGGKSVFVETKAENGFKITAEELENAITEKTKVLILNTPNNPTGAVYSKEEIYSLAKILEKHEVFCISDEIYEKLCYVEKPVSIATYGEKMKELTIVVNGLSKSYAMTGWRVGYLAANKEIAEVIDCVQSHMTSNVNSIAQEASYVAFSRTDDVERLCKVYEKRRDYMYNRLSAMKGVKPIRPDGAFYMFVNVKDLYNDEVKNSFDFCHKLLEYKVAAIPGAPFGNDGYIRLSFAVSDEDIKVGLDRIAQMVNDL